MAMEMRKEAHAEARRPRTRRHELCDRQWELVKDLWPVPKKRRPAEAGKVLNGMLWILRPGAPWRDLRERYGPWRTVYDRFNLWSRGGTLDRAVSRLRAQMDAQGGIAWELFCVDGSVVRAGRAAAGARKKSRRENRQIMRWAAPGADFPPRYTCWSLERACL